jgi:predicted Holliday junction resolvase-like endonuclease
MADKNNKHQEIIKTLKTGNFYLECPNTDEEVAVKTLQLFDNDNFTEEAIEIYQQQLNDIRATKERLKRLKNIGATKSESGAHSVNIGFILERLAPTMGSFRFKHNDCRSLFDPIDYVIFEGLAEKGRVDKIFFIDIKTGNAKLNKRQKEIKTVINSKKVNFKKF